MHSGYGHALIDAGAASAAQSDEWTRPRNKDAQGDEGKRVKAIGSGQVGVPRELYQHAVVLEEGTGVGALRSRKREVRCEKACTVQV